MINQAVEDCDRGWRIKIAVARSRGLGTWLVCSYGSRHMLYAVAHYRGLKSKDFLADLFFKEHK